MRRRQRIPLLQLLKPGVRTPRGQSRLRHPLPGGVSPPPPPTPSSTQPRLRVRAPPRRVCPNHMYQANHTHHTPHHPSTPHNSPNASSTNARATATSSAPSASALSARLTRRSTPTTVVNALWYPSHLPKTYPLIPP